MRENQLIPDADLAENIRDIRQRVALAAQKSGRKESDISIMAVTNSPGAACQPGNCVRPDPFGGK